MLLESIFAWRSVTCFCNSATLLVSEFNEIRICSWNFLISCLWTWASFLSLKFCDEGLLTKHYQKVFRISEVLVESTIFTFKKYLIGEEIFSCDHSDSSRKSCNILLIRKFGDHNRLCHKQRYNSFLQTGLQIQIQEKEMSTLLLLWGSI